MMELFGQRRRKTRPNSTLESTFRHDVNLTRGESPFQRDLGIPKDTLAKGGKGRSHGRAPNKYLISNARKRANMLVRLNPPKLPRTAIDIRKRGNVVGPGQSSHRSLFAMASKDCSALGLASIEVQRKLEASKSSDKNSSNLSGLVS